MKLMIINITYFLYSIMSYSFSKKGDLEAYVNVTYNDFATLIKSIWADIVEKELS